MSEVSAASVVRRLQLVRPMGAAPGSCGACRRPVLLPERGCLLTRVAAATDLTPRTVRAKLAEHGVRMSYRAL